MRHLLHSSGNGFPAVAVLQPNDSKIVIKKGRIESYPLTVDQKFGNEQHLQHWQLGWWRGKGTRIPPITFPEFDFGIDSRTLCVGSICWSPKMLNANFNENYPVRGAAVLSLKRLYVVLFFCPSRFFFRKASAMKIAKVAPYTDISSRTRLQSRASLEPC